MVKRSLDRASHEGRRESVVRTLPVAFGDDAGLAGALAEGHPAAAAAAWDRFAPLARSLLLQTLGPGADVDDLLQDVFITLFRRAADLRDPSALSSFVVGITVRTARSELRRRRLWRWISLTSGGDLPDEPAPSQDHRARIALRSLYAVLDRLDADARLTFLLRHAQGLELTEIAAALDCSLATAKRKLARATERVVFHARRDPALAEYVDPEGGAS